MRNEFLQTAAVALALLGGASLALAQQPPAEPQQQPQQDKAQQTPSGQAGKEEPSSNTPTVKPRDDAALVDGAPAVPGAPADTSTVPAKFSAKNAADDKLITTAHTFKTLTDEQRRAIFEALKGQPAGPAFNNANVGDQLPPAVELRAMPNEVAARVPQTRDYQYAVTSDRVLLVSPADRIVVGAFPDVKATEAGEGRSR
jgi:Protein of unknown function (DUF1236)